MMTRKYLQPSGYASAEESRKPGYLAARFAAIKRELKAQAEAKAAASAKVAPIRKRQP